MKRELLEKVKSYSAVAAGLIAAENVAGQVVYVNVDPDIEVHGNFDAVNWQDPTAWATQAIDLDDDGNADYTLRILSGQQHGAGFLDPAGDNQYVNNPNNNPFGAPLESGAQIGGVESQVWKGLLVYPNGYNYLGTTTTFGKTLEEGGGGWTGKTDKYLGLKFKIGSNVHYGWARLDARDDSRMYTLKDFAYESTPDTPIHAGDGMVGVNEVIANNLKIFTNGTSVIIDMVEQIKGLTQAKVYNIAGQEMAVNAINGLRTEIHLNVPAGIYFVKVNLEAGQYVQKVMIK